MAVGVACITFRIIHVELVLFKQQRNGIFIAAGCLSCWTRCKWWMKVNWLIYECSTIFVWWSWSFICEWGVTVLRDWIEVSCESLVRRDSEFRDFNTTSHSHDQQQKQTESSNLSYYNKNILKSIIWIQKWLYAKYTLSLKSRRKHAEITTKHQNNSL